MVSSETYKGDGMGQKVHPIGFRLGINKTWQSNWYAKRNYADLLHEDLMIRRHIKTRLYHAGISKVEIERAANRAKINIYSLLPKILRFNLSGVWPFGAL